MHRLLTAEMQMILISGELNRMLRMSSEVRLLLPSLGPVSLLEKSTRDPSAGLLTLALIFHQMF
jgi:hypothetical protein